MPTMEVIFRWLAAREYRSARDWYAEHSPNLAEQFRIRRGPSGGENSCRA